MLNISLDFEVCTKPRIRGENDVALVWGGTFKEWHSTAKLPTGTGSILQAATAPDASTERETNLCAQI